MNRRSTLLTASLFAFAAVLASNYLGTPPRTEAYPIIDGTPLVVTVQPEAPAPAPAPIPGVETVPTSHTASVCTAGGCSSGSVRRGVFSRRPLFGRNRVRGRWYPGKNLGRLFGRRR